MTARPPRHATELETISVDIPEHALETYEAAFAEICGTVGFFLDESSGRWIVEGVKQRGEGEAELSVALTLAEVATGVSAPLRRHETPAEGWLARTYSGFPEQFVGRRFALRGTHLAGPRAAGRITLVLDAGMAFGSGEHGSTRGCLRALERIATRRPRRILDLGTGSGVLAMAAARLLGRPVTGTDIDPWAVRVAADNARRNGLSRRVRFIRADGWRAPALRRGAPYDLVFANILARPLCRMAVALAAHLAPGGTAILAGLLGSQVRMVLAAHRPTGLRLQAELRDGNWSTLILRKAGAPSPPAHAGGGAISHPK